MFAAHFQYIRQAAILIIASCFGTTPYALPIYQDVLPGQYLAIDFQFNVIPFEATGGADILLANGGSVSNGLLGSHVSLYHADILVATFDNQMANTFGLFKDPASPYNVWGVIADLQLIFQGGNSRIEFHPIFDSSVANAFVNYQLVFFGATQSTGVSSLSETMISPTISVTEVREIPIPPTYTLMTIGILSLLAFNCRRGKGK